MRYKCLLCGRAKFTKPSAHNCAGGFRKRKIKWEKIEGKQIVSCMKRIVVFLIISIVAFSCSTQTKPVNVMRDSPDWEDNFIKNNGIRVVVASEFTRGNKTIRGTIYRNTTDDAIVYGAIFDTLYDAVITRQTSIQSSDTIERWFYLKYVKSIDQNRINVTRMDGCDQIFYKKTIKGELCIAALRQPTKDDMYTICTLVGLDF